VGVTIESYGKLETRKERRRIRIIIIIRNGAKTISPPNFVWEDLIKGFN
jgi:hypothetical protein